MHPPLHRADGRGDLVDVSGGHARFPPAVLCALLQEPRPAVGEQSPAMVRDRRGLQRVYRTADPQFPRKIRLDCPVHKVERSTDGVVIHSAAGSETFDRVVFACHSDQALALLADPSEAEQAILGAMPYADNDVVLHTDTRLLPARKLAWASWNYRLTDSLDTQAAVTYDMNILQGIDSATTFCVSLNQTPMIDPLKILARFTYAHPQYSLAAVAAQARWEELNGARNTFYCGAYWANGFHEDGVVSALRVAQAFGETL
ncbi:FAD-dependent oxidoreductase [Pseudomonas poae]